MERILAISAAAAVLVSWLVTGVMTRRNRSRRRAAQDRAAELASRLDLATSRVDSLALGEREAAWSARVLAAAAESNRLALADSAAALEAAGREATTLESTIDALRDDLRTTAAELAGARRDLDDTSTRLAQVETELARSASDQAIVDSEEVMAALQVELGETRRSVAAHAAEARDLRHRLAVAERGVPDLAPAQAELAAEVEELRRRLADTTLPARIAQLEAELSAAAAPPAVPPDLDELASHRAETARLRAALAEAQAAAGEAEEQRRSAMSAAADLRARVAAAERAAGALRGDLGSSRQEVERLRAAAEDARQEADRRLAASGARISELERSARAGDRGAAVLTARDAVIADLSQRLAALGAARNAELRRLNDKIASMERLYVDVEVRDRRIVVLEEELKDTAEARDAALGEVVRMERSAAELRAAHREAAASLERYAGLERELLSARARIVELEERLTGDVLAVEVERLRGALEAERTRAERTAQRSALIEQRPSKYAEWDRMLREKVETAVAAAIAPLQARIDHLHRVTVEKENRLAALTARPAPPRGPDDLTRIRGIGPKIAAILHGLGITTFAEIAAFTDPDVARVGAELPVYPGRIVDDDWIEQARAFAGE